MNRRVLSDKQARWLQGELVEWRSRSIVTPEQSDQILACYETADEVSQRKRSHFTFAIIAIAALLVGLAGFLLIGHNWDEMSRVAKLAVIFGVIGATHAGGLYLRFARGAQKASEIAFFLGCLFYGAGIWLVAQVFHLDAHYPDGMWWWALGVLPFALCTETLLIQCLYAGLLATWAGMEVFGFRNLETVLFGWWPVPNGAYSLLLLAAPGLLWSYRKGSVGGVGLYALLLAWWVILQSFAWNLDYYSFFLIGTVGALMLIVAENHRPGNRLATPYRFWGTLLAAGALVPMGFGGFFREVAHYYNNGWHSTSTGPAVAQLVGILMLLAVTIAFTSLFKPEQPGSTRGPMDRLGDLCRTQWLPLGLVLGMAFMCLWCGMHDFRGDQNRDWILPTVVGNVGIIGLALWLMRVGIRDDHGRPFAFGVFYFVLWAICRYCDLFGEKGGMLGASLMFFLCGAFLFGLGMFWRGRKEARHA